MIYQVKLILRGEERDITDFKYRCHVSHHDDPNLDKMIELHQKICKEIGNEEPLPVEGDLIELTFNSTDHDQFFYDWMFLDAMQDGEIHFIYNEVETADIFRFWDCYCIGLEESMSAGGQPMAITIFLSPAIIKRNNMEPREKEWKVTDIQIKPITATDEQQIVYIQEAYWFDEGGNKQTELELDFPVTLYVQTKDYIVNKSVNLVFKDDSMVKEARYSGTIDEKGIIKIENFKLETIDQK